MYKGYCADCDRETTIRGYSDSFLETTIERSRDATYDLSGRQTGWQDRSYPVTRERSYTLHHCPDGHILDNWAVGAKTKEEYRHRAYVQKMYRRLVWPFSIASLFCNAVASDILIVVPVNWVFPGVVMALAPGVAVVQLISVFWMPSVLKKVLDRWPHRTSWVIAYTVIGLAGIAGSAAWIWSLSNGSGARHPAKDENGQAVRSISLSKGCQLLATRNTKGALISRLATGKECKLLDSQKDWLKVECGGAVGWTQCAPR